jgi:hypothetical protein
MVRLVVVGILFTILLTACSKPDYEPLMYVGGPTEPLSSAQWVKFICTAAESHDDFVYPLFWPDSDSWRSHELTYQKERYARLAHEAKAALEILLRQMKVWTPPSGATAYHQTFEARIKNVISFIGKTNSAFQAATSLEETNAIFSEVRDYFDDRPRARFDSTYRQLSDETQRMRRAYAGQCGGLIG